MAELDSWEDLEVEGQQAAPAGGFNAAAASFVPNLGAAEFVPSWAAPAAEPAAPVPVATEPAAPAPAAAAAAPVDPVVEKVTEQVAEVKIEEPKKVEEKPAEEAKKEEAKPKEAPKVKGPEPVVEDDDDDDVDDDDDEDDKREHVNVVFIGHVDAGKSTIGGHLMFLTGGVDQRTLDKYEREAKEKNRESWYLSWALDTNEEERAKGKTVEYGKANFTTETKHYTIIDAPGHKSFVPNMISGAVQADIAILVISARRGEFETGFDRGGQTREHAMLAKTAGVVKLVIVINKMDDSTVEWKEERFTEIKDKLKPFLRQVGFSSKDCKWIPVSGYTGENLLKGSDKIPWYSGKALVPYLDSLPKIARQLDAPFRMPITDKFRDMGTMVAGKIISGKVKKGQNVLLMPNKNVVGIDTIYVDDEQVEHAQSGDNVKLKLKNIEEEDIMPGYVLCPKKAPCSYGTVFDAQVVIIEYKTIICNGFQAVLHIHSTCEEVALKAILCMVDKKTGKAVRDKGRPRFVKQGDVCIARLECAGPICVETFKDYAGMGRFTLRDEGKTIAIGKVLKVIS